MNESKYTACSINHAHPCNEPGYKGPACPVITVPGFGTAAAHVCCGGGKRYA